MATSTKRQAAAKTVDIDDVIDALSKAVAEGDIVNFRTLFAPFSPGRADSSQSFDMPKYAYLLPDEETADSPAFSDARAVVKHPEVLDTIRKELEANRPPRVPWRLVLMLGDNAVRLHKYSSAAQAYELLRIRARIQSEFLAQADAALDAGDIAKAARGYVIGVGLAYDYAAFPEPLPITPDFQTRALVLHAEYPVKPEDSIGFREPRILVQIALSYLLLDPEIAARLDGRPMEVRIAFLKELVALRDPEWDAFLMRYREAVEAVRELSERLQSLYADSVLAEEINAHIASGSEGDDAARIPALLLGYRLEDGEWWQYLKELVHRHPAAALIVARQALGDFEILVPRYAPDSPVAKALGL